MLKRLLKSIREKAVTYKFVDNLVNDTEEGLFSLWTFKNDKIIEVENCIEVYGTFYKVSHACIDTYNSGYQPKTSLMTLMPNPAYEMNQESRHVIDLLTELAKDEKNLLRQVELLKKVQISLKAQKEQLDHAHNAIYHIFRDIEFNRGLHADILLKCPDETNRIGWYGLHKVDMTKHYLDKISAQNAYHEHLLTKFKS